jgi:hypothetical protein
MKFWDGELKHLEAKDISNGSKELTASIFRTGKLIPTII